MTYTTTQTKKSNFTTDDAITNASLFDFIKAGVNKKTTWQNIIDQIAAVYGLGIRLYETESAMVADTNLSLGDHAIVEENRYGLYEVSNISAQGLDVTLSNGLVALFNGSLTTGSQPSYTELKSINPATLTDDDVVNLAYRSTKDDGGGGQFRWDSSDNSAAVTADAGEGIYVPPSSDSSGASGAWVRQGIYTKFTIDSVSAMVALPLIVGTEVRTVSYHSGWAARNQGAIGGGDYLIKTSAEATSDGNLVDEVVNHTLSNGHIAILIFGDKLNATQAGAVPNSAAFASETYSAITSSMLQVNQGGTVLLPAVAGETFNFYQIDEPIEISATGTNVTAVCLEGESGELVFLRPSDDFVGNMLIALYDATGSVRWGNKFKNLVIQSKKPDATFLNYVFHMRDSEIVSFDNTYFEGSSVANAWLEDSFAYQFNGCTFEDSAAHILFTGAQKIGDITLCNFNGGGPFSFSTATGYVDVSECTFNSLTGGVTCEIMNFRDNTIRNPNGTTSSPIIISRDTTHSIRGNKIVYTDARTSNCTSVIRVDAANAITSNISNDNLHDGSAPYIAYLNNSYNALSPIVFTQDEVSTSNYTITYTSGTNTIQGTRTTSGYVRYMQDGVIKLATPTNPTEAFTVADDNSLVFDFLDLTFRVVTTTDLTEHQVEIGLRVDGFFAFTCQDLFRRDSTNFSAGRIFAYDDRYTSG